MPSRVGQSVPVITNGMPSCCAWIILPRACVGRASCSPVRILGSAPIGLKYRSDSTRMGWEAAMSANMASHTALVRAYGLCGSMTESSSTLRSAPAR